MLIRALEKIKECNKGGHLRGRGQGALTGAVREDRSGPNCTKLREASDAELLHQGGGDTKHRGLEADESLVC